MPIWANRVALSIKAFFRGAPDPPTFRLGRRHVGAGPSIYGFPTSDIELDVGKP